MEVESEIINNTCFNIGILCDENNKKTRDEKNIYGPIFLRESNFKNSHKQTIPKTEIRMI